MSRQTMTEAAAQLPRPPLYGLASCWVGTDYMDFEIGWSEFERDIEWAESVIRRAGLQRGDMVLTTFTNWESPWASPVTHALRQVGITYMTAEVFGWDVRRVLMFLQRFPVKAIMGLGAQTLTGLAEAGVSVSDLFANVDIIWARPRAVVALRENKMTSLPFVRFGPALAMGLPGQPGALVNAREWDVTATGQGLVVSSVSKRATTFRDVATGFDGTATRIRDDIVVNGESAR